MLKLPGDIARGFPGSLLLSGDTYLLETFGFSYENVWRNFGILMLFTIVFIALTAYFTELFEWSEGSDRAIEYKPASMSRAGPALITRDEEEKPVEADHRAIPLPESPLKSDSSAAPKTFALRKSAFTWKDIKYTIPYSGGTRTLLNNVSGYCISGQMTALVGSSGAGKTTCMFSFYMGNW